MASQHLPPRVAATKTCWFAASLVFLVVLGFVTAAQSPGPTTAPVNQAMQQIRAEAIRAHMRFLSDDLLEGRGTGTRGYELASKYVAAQLEAMGLEPAGANGTYFQPLPLRKIELVPGQSSLRLVRDGKELMLKYPEDFLTWGDPLRTDSSVEAPVVFVGFGVTAPERNYDDYTSADVRGRIVAMLQGAPARFPATERAYYSSLEVKFTNAASHGAVGILNLLPPEWTERYRWSWIAIQTKLPSMRWLDPKGMPNNAQPQIRGRAALSPTGAEVLFKGAAKSLEEVFAAARANQPQALPLPVTAKIRNVSLHSSLESSNIVAVLRGSDPQMHDEYVVYSAHLDHLGIGPAVDGDAIYHGAGDNASGVAELLEVARAFSRLPQPPRRSVLFLVVTGEEKGSLGSDYFVHYPTVPRANIVANFNIDGAPGLLYPLRDVVPLGAEHSTLNSVVEEAAKQMGLEISPDPMPEESFFIRSDQYSFVRGGIPAVLIEEGLKSSDPKLDGRAIMLHWMQSVYHTPKDNMNQPFYFDSAAKSTQLNFLVGYGVAQQTTRPSWNPGDFFGQKFGGQHRP